MMINPVILEEAFLEFSNNLQKWIPDGVIHVDLKVLHDLGLLNQSELEHSVNEENLSLYFHIIETPDKVTLYNDQFAIWIIPQLVQDIPTTTTMISLLQGNKPHLEIVYTTTGVYNAPKYILKILQHFLAEVQDTEAVISSIGKKK
ncbi:MAG: hypothetical protein K2P51_03375 [Rhabdochlamydiaceae bacterium]|nr:hypothetical protein [Rhabdochlamydiaceae bacterium]